MAKLSYLGPEGTFTHQAARDLARAGEELVPLGSVRDVVQSVESGGAAAGVVAFESSLEGPVPANLDELLLKTSRCMIAGERVLPVSFTLYRTPGDESPLKGVTSHAFGLVQCSRFIEDSGVQFEEATSTAGGGPAACAAGPAGRGRRPRPRRPAARGRAGDRPAARRGDVRPARRARPHRGRRARRHAFRVAPD